MHDAFSPKPALHPEAERLSRRVAELAGCSRREAELLIANGAVRVGGRIATVPGDRIGPDQVVELLAGAKAEPAAAVTLLVHKLPGVPWDTPATRLLAPAQRSVQDANLPALLPVQRTGLQCHTPLGNAAAGLLVLTQDPRIARKLLEDAATLEHELRIDIAGPVPAEALRRLNGPGTKASIGSEVEGLTRLRVATKGFAPGELARRCDAAGLRIAGMLRLRIGRVPLAGLEPGGWRLLLPHERF